MACGTVLPLRLAKNRATWCLRPSSGVLALHERLPRLGNFAIQQRNYAVDRDSVNGRPSTVSSHGSSSSNTGSELARTPLYDLHIAHGAKMVPFAGYSMPVQYEDQGIAESHRWTREKASLFDVSHMVQHRMSGPGAEGLLQRITPSSIKSLKANHSTLSCLLHPGTGGILDDMIVTRLREDGFYVVTNAACREKDKTYIKTNIKDWVSQGNPKLDWRVLRGWGLIALQGPLAVGILQKILHDAHQVNLNDLYFGQSKWLQLGLASGEASDPVLVSRGGYTGEDGFEISIHPAYTEQVAKLLLNSAGPEKLRLAGLGARDSLRIEAGMCLYGHDMDDSTTPVEAGLSWIVGKDRRTDDAGFHGSEVILRQLKPKKDGGTGVSRRRVGFVVEGAVAREGAEIVDGEGNAIGKITSGCPSPTLNKNIAMGYIKDGLHKAGTEVSVVVRGKKRKATVTRMPFVPSKYWKGGATPG